MTKEDRDDMREVRSAMDQFLFYGVTRWIVLAIVLGIVGMGFTIWGDTFDIWRTNTFGVAKEDAHRNVYTRTQSYVQGTQRRLNTLCSQRADASDKRMFNGIISHEMVELDPADVPDSLVRKCLTDARANATD